MSVFPSAPDIFVDKSGADAISSSDPNNCFDALENIENFLGASGQPQSKSVTLANVFRAMFAPLPECSWIDNDTVAILQSQAVIFSTNNFVVKRNTSAITCCLSLHLDTGSELASKWYELYLVGDGANTQYTAKFALQGSNPTGVSFYKKINSFYNDGSSNILKFFQTGNLIMWNIPVIVTTTPSSGAWSSALSCANAIPAISLSAIFGLQAYVVGDDTGVFIRPNGSTWSINPENGIYFLVGGGSSIMATGQRICLTDNSQQIQYYNITASETAIGVEGYYISIK